MSQTILIIAEHRNGEVRQVTFEAITAAQIVDASSINVVAIGHKLETVVETLSNYELDTIFTIDDQSLSHYIPEAYAHALGEVLEECQPTGIICGHTAIGRDLAPMLAATLDAGLISDATSIECVEEHIVITRPIYAGKAFEKKIFHQSPWVLTIRPNNVSASTLKGNVAQVKNISFKKPPSLQSTIIDIVQKTTGKIDLAEAKIVIAGGRGVKSAEGFKPLEQLADVLNGAVGASRGACDANYCDYSLQIGQTGKVVTPDLYIACGISGAIQHVAGMSQSRIIVAINKDPDAPIFSIADYGIVGDLFEIVPLLTEEFRKVMKEEA
ncbi:electron transfer flavoprotein subunit alpha/FixB family protein [Halalkalibacter hemicellulosilyticus]|uniref:Electron transfer flavoprotein n=1 Tax=Halalkalibacter hemicellulosilyticusJCM 9152 TaxID=1236971 RepID=W4QKW1_9BACI|nr:electron transfer flavoprotein subunit alpha/FixB family protein [Halalkalibacter hemicellulosilyticus]GAE32537.1 electron transfer flavoprotein [Halalkalibacter hemicellulosilyticusJCM 9152]